MLKHRGDDVVFALFLHLSGGTFQRPVVRFGTAAGKVDFARLGAQGVGHLPAGLVQGFFRLASNGIDAGGVSILLFIERKHCLQYTRGNLSGCGIVRINKPFFHRGNTPCRRGRLIPGEAALPPAGKWAYALFNYALIVYLKSIIFKREMKKITTFFRFCRELGENGKKRLCRSGSPRISISNAAYPQEGPRLGAAQFAKALRHHPLCFSDWATAIWSQRSFSGCPAWPLTQTNSTWW